MEDQGQQTELGEGLRVSRELPVKLTDAEKSQLGSRLCALLNEEEAIDAKKRARVAECNAELKEVRKKTGRVRGAIETGEEIRDVQCLERAGSVNGTFELVRLDTGETIETNTDVERAAREAQGELPLQRPGKACEHCGNADGSHRSGVTHGYARAELNVSKEDRKKGLEKHEIVVALTGSQREGLEVDEDGTVIGSVAIEHEGKSYTLLALVEPDEEEMDRNDVEAIGDEDDDAPDNGAEALEQLGGDVVYPPEDAGEIAAPKKGKGRKGKKDGDAPRVRA